MGGAAGLGPVGTLGNAAAPVCGARMGDEGSCSARAALALTASGSKAMATRSAPASESVAQLLASSTRAPWVSAPVIRSDS